MSKVSDLNLNVPFVGHYQIHNLNICDSVIDHFKKSTPEKGMIYKADGSLVVDKKLKDSLDLKIKITNSTDNSIKQYLNALELCLRLYLKKYKFLNTIVSPWRIIEDVNIQYYPPGGGFKEWHCERLSPITPYVNRVLVFMTYLNTVEEKNNLGGTEWYYQKLKLSAVKGSTVIWPVDWMFTHRGIPAIRNEKYIITGWYNFIE